MKWFRWYHDTASDTKLGVVALRSKQPKVAVIALWVYLLEEASKADDRGSLEFMDIEAAMLALSLEEEAIQAIIEAMNCKALIVDNRIANWEKRQPDSDTTEADRAKKYRDRKRHGRVTVASRDDVVTNGDRHGTEEETDQNRTEKKIPPTPKGESEAFLKFWDEYPKKVGKPAALSKWNSKQLDPRLQEIMDGLKVQKASQQWLKDNGQFIPNPATYLHQDRWLDQVILPKPEPGQLPKKTRLELLQEAISQGKAFRDKITGQVIQADRLQLKTVMGTTVFVLLDDPTQTREPGMLEVVP